MMKKNHRYTHMYVCMYRLEPFGLLKRLVRRWSTTWQCDLWSYLWLMIISSFSFFPTLPINTAKIHHKKGLFNIFLKVSSSQALFSLHLCFLYIIGLQYLKPFYPTVFREISINQKKKNKGFLIFPFFLSFGFCRLLHIYIYIYMVLFFRYVFVTLSHSLPQWVRKRIVIIDHQNVW